METDTHLNTTISRSVTLQPMDNQRLANLCGQFGEHLTMLEQHFNVHISNRSNQFQITGEATAVTKTSKALQDLYSLTQHSQHVSKHELHLILHENTHHSQAPEYHQTMELAVRKIKTRTGMIVPKGLNQIQYVHNINQYDINFAIGPAGTGKTFLAVACAVEALESQRIKRLILVRPAVEAGEKLGFLPGDLVQKVDPYLRPLYDALYEMVGFERVLKLIDQSMIEVAPLAFMRGRTLNESFIILDESQNTTREQMKMFLTRIGFGSITVITGDITQVDLPKGIPSGLNHAANVLKGVPGIHFNHFSVRDVVRHPLVQRIIDAYEQHE